jgi:hypothetical protein
VPSGSLDALPSNCTTIGAVPEEGLAVNAATGELLVGGEIAPEEPPPPQPLTAAASVRTRRLIRTYISTSIQESAADSAGTNRDGDSSLPPYRKPALVADPVVSANSRSAGDATTDELLILRRGFAENPAQLLFYFCSP